MFGRNAKRTAFNSDWESFRSAGRAPLKDQHPGTASSVLPWQPHFRHFISGPTVGNLVAASLPSEARPHALQRHGLLAHKALRTVLGDSSYGGLVRWDSQHVSFSVWKEYGDAVRLVVYHDHQLGPSDIAVSYSHCVFWHQGWMQDHGADDYSWAELSTNYEEHFSMGGTYWEVAEAFQRGERRWAIKTLFGNNSKSFLNLRFGVGFDSEFGDPIYRSRSLGSFFHFAALDEPFTSGQLVSKDVARAQQVLALTRLPSEANSQQEDNTPDLSFRSPVDQEP